MFKVLKNSIRFFSDFSKKYILKNEIKKLKRSSVFLCEEIETNKLFAVKNYHINNDAKREKKKDEVRSEFSILKKYSEHLNIINVYDIFDEDSYMSIVMDYYSKGSLKTILQESETFSEEQTKMIMKQLLETLSYLHDNNMFHLDIKLDNILLDDKNNIKLIDFEFAVYEHQIDQRKLVRGTPSYLSPEMARRIVDQDSPLPERPADIWSSGICMFTMLMGKLDAENYNLFNDIMNVKKKSENLSPEIVDLMERMLTVNPKARISAKEALRHPLFD